MRVERAEMHEVFVEPAKLLIERDVGRRKGAITLLGAARLARPARVGALERAAQTAQERRDQGGPDQQTLLHGRLLRGERLHCEGLPPLVDGAPAQAAARRDVFHENRALV